MKKDCPFCLPALKKEFSIYEAREILDGKYNKTICDYHWELASEWYPDISLDDDIDKYLKTLEKNRRT